MSHITEIEGNVTSVPALRAAVAQFPELEWREGQMTHRAYGRSGQCIHAIAVKGSTEAYEIGVTPRTDGKPGFLLALDSWAGGRGLMQVVGQGAGKLLREYGAQVAIERMHRQGLRLETRRTLDTGKIHLEFVEA